jgi:hypothetical protein
LVKGRRCGFEARAIVAASEKKSFGYNNLSSGGDPGVPIAAAEIFSLPIGTAMLSQAGISSVCR